MCACFFKKTLICKLPKLAIWNIFCCCFFETSVKKKNVFSTLGSGLSFDCAFGVLRASVFFNICIV